MTIQRHEITPAIIGPPTPTTLDGILFLSIGPEAESAWRSGEFIGDLHHDDEHDCWVASLNDGDWHRMRCRAEARAYIVAADRGRANILRRWAQVTAA